MSPRLLVFDLDGTLVDSAPDLVGSLNVILAQEGLPPLPLEAARNFIGHGARALLLRGFAESGETPDSKRAEALTRDFLDHYAANIAIRSRTFPGVFEALDRFVASGWRLAICTNKAEGLSRLLLDGLGLTSRFAAIVGGDTFGVSKPDPRSLLGTIGRAGSHAAFTTMVGDSASDIGAARAAGVPVVAVDFGYTEVPVRDLGPNAVISHFDELWEAVSSLERREIAASPT